MRSREKQALQQPVRAVQAVLPQDDDGTVEGFGDTLPGDLAGARAADTSAAAAPRREEAPAADAAPLGRIGPYELQAVLAHEGLGQVFKGWDSTDGVDVMITLLDLEADARDREAIIAQMQQSVLKAAALKHPGLARIHDAGVVGGGVYIVYAWQGGRTLGMAQRAGWQPTARVAACVVRDLAQALAHAHAHGVLHGGLNPSNVMLDADDKATVLGLGYAGPAHASDVPSMDPLVSGAAHYLAPEQFQGGTVDERTDVHALGVLLYELLAGHRAYPGETVPEVARALMAHDPAPPHWLRLDVPDRLSAIAMQALQRNPAARYAHASQVASALQAWLEQSEQETDTARDYFVAEQTQPLPAPKKRYGMSAALLGAALAVLAFTWVERADPDDAGLPARDAQARSGVVTSGAAATPVDAAAVDTARAPQAGLAADAAPPAGPPASLPATLPAATTVAQGAALPSVAAAGVVAVPNVVAAAPAEIAAPQAPAGQSVATAVVQPAALPAVAGPVPPAAPPAQAALPRGPSPAAEKPSPAPAAEKRAPARAPVRANAAADTKAQPSAGLAAPRDKARAATAEARPAAAAGLLTGTVQLAVSPWGYVEVGGKVAGASPPLQKLTLPEGTHTITIRNEDFAPYVTTVQVSADKAATVRHRFAQ